MKKILLFIIFIFLQLSVFSQNSDYIVNYGSKNILIHRDVRLDTLVQRVINLNEEEAIIRGYRIQIYQGSNRMNANNLKAKFILSYPDIPIYMIYQQPYFKLRVGDFRNRLESLKMYNLLLENPDFKSVLVVPDEIKLPELKCE